MQYKRLAMMTLAEPAHVLAWLLFGNSVLALTLPLRPFHELVSKGMAQVSVSKLWKTSRYSQDCLFLQSDSLHPAFSKDIMNSSCPMTVRSSCKCRVLELICE